MNMETASPILIDAHRDFALLKLENSRSSKSMQLSREIISSGHSCGSLGFPLSSITVQDDHLNINLTERFQGGYVSAYIEEYTEGELFSWYETDSLMYSGSSGCPVFTVNGTVFGMQAATLIGDEDSEDESRRLSISRLVPSLDMINMTRSIGIEV